VIVRLLEFLKTRSYETSKQEELLYEFVATELETGSLSKGLWTKALAETEFDDARARALYIKMRVASLTAELRELAPHLKQIDEARSRLTKLLEQGCSQEAIDYLGNPILAENYVRKYRVSMEKINKAISIKAMKACIVDGRLWVQDRPL
jgi:hypothetical protein